MCVWRVLLVMFWWLGVSATVGTMCECSHSVETQAAVISGKGQEKNFPSSQQDQEVFFF